MNADDIDQIPDFGQKWLKPALLIGPIPVDGDEAAKFGGDVAYPAENIDIEGVENGPAFKPAATQGIGGHRDHARSGEAGFVRFQFDIKIGLARCENV